ncbi:VOC family protein [Magnetospirillum sp. 64-120]|uniref:VOC family protein n=1 Tax=Magnetospirillum sp. 64-120 TaxID=1895778 RepID=UPI00092C9B47|nr:VOC family protein [Magnetospirillum sp. 64-120]OJX70479.1 MAG: hypothetical protein BGO92_18065 [Magnetospirillum sp. 64-120]
MDKTPHVCTWFELAAQDLDRAQKFYEALFPGALSRMTCDVAGEMVVFDAPAEAVKGGIVKAQGTHQPGSGAIVYLNGGADLAVPLSRVEAAGGKVLLPKTALPESWGFMAHIVDSEGNLVGLHSLS